MKRNNFLDIVKGVCILLVILTHFKWEEAEKLQYLFPFWMNPAVPIFMIISGYVSTESFKRKNVETFGQAYGLKGIVDKLIRYLTPFVLVFVVELLLTIFVFKQDIDLPVFIMKMVVGGSNPGSYYVPYMVQFVFLFPLIYFVVKKFDFNGLLLCAAANVLYELAKIPLGLSHEVFRLLVFRYIFAIAFGCYISIGKKPLKKWMGVVSFLVGAGFLLVTDYMGYKPVVFYRWRRTCILAVLYIAPIAYLFITKCKWNFKPLEIMGKASYNIFLMQMVFFHFANGVYGGVDGAFLPMLFSYAVCIGMGILFYYIETPITKKVLALNAKLMNR